MKRWFKKSKSDSKQQLHEALQGMELPRFQQGVPEILDAIRNPDSQTRQIVARLQLNPGLVVGVLRTVNSAAFGLRSKVDSLEHGVTLLGRSKLELLVLGTSVQQALPSGAAPGFDGRRFWSSAFARAGLARALADRLHPAEGPRCFLGGLLQDMAVPLAAHARPEDYGDVLKDYHGTPQSDLSRLEQEALGWTHEELGSSLAVAWDLPETLAQVIAEHHVSPDDEDGLAPPAVRLAAAYHESQREYGLEVLVEQARDLFELDPDWVRDSVSEAESGAEELVRSLPPGRAA